MIKSPYAEEMTTLTSHQTIRKIEKILTENGYTDWFIVLAKDRGTQVSSVYCVKNIWIVNCIITFILDLMDKINNKS